MKVKFKSGYMGKETNETWVEAGVVTEIDDEAYHLVEVGLAEEVTEPELPDEKPAKRSKRSAHEA